MRYSLADYIVSIEVNDAQLKNLFDAVSIGGEGNYTNSITLSSANSQWQTTSYATGGWVHNKNLARNGTVTLDINQLTAQIAKFKQLVNVHYSGSYEGLTLTLTDADNVEVARCVDCYFEKIPDQQYTDTAGNQSWTLTCGQIIYN